MIDHPKNIFIKSKTYNPTIKSLEKIMAFGTDVADINCKEKTTDFYVLAFQLKDEKHSNLLPDKFSVAGSEWIKTKSKDGKTTFLLNDTAVDLINEKDNSVLDDAISFIEQLIKQAIYFEKQTVSKSNQHLVDKMNTKNPEFRNITVLARVSPGAKYDESFLELYSDLLKGNARNCTVKTLDLLEQSELVSFDNIQSNTSKQNHFEFLKRTKTHLDFKTAYGYLADQNLRISRLSWIKQQLPVTVAVDREKPAIDKKMDLIIIFNNNIANSIGWKPTEEDKEARDWFIV